MAKKKKVEPEEDEFDNGDLDDFEEEEIEIAVPTLEKKPPAKEKEKLPPPEDILSDEVSMEDLAELEFEPEEEKPNYRFLDLKLIKGSKENDYELSIISQSHGFCNIFVKHLLKIKGVNIAAYKDTGLEPPTIFIRLEKGFNIKKILNQGIETLREEVISVEKLFQKLL
jgi:DNA-directed RNA polymerase subunit L